MAESAASDLEAALARGAPAAELIGLASATALKAQRAAQNLRRAGMTRLVEVRRAEASAASAAPSLPSARGPRPASLPSARGPRPAPSDHHHGAQREQANPDVDAITSYARIASLGLRHLGTYLELAPIALRRKAFEELAKLCKEEANWAGLRVLVREAKLVEADPDLKRKLTDLDAQLGPG